MFKEKALEASQKFSRAALAPVMFMTITGTVIALGVLLQLKGLPVGVQITGEFLKTMMDSMMNNLSIVFCVGLGTGLAKKKKVDAAILSIIVFLMFLASNNAWLTINDMLAEPGMAGLFGTGQAEVLGFQVTDMGVFLGMILGCLTGWIHNKFSDKEFIDIFRAYGGSRLAYTIAIPVIGLLAIVITYIWPIINNGINATTDLMSTSGAFGVFLYGFGNRFLIPTGLHHLLWMPFTLSAVGGTAEIAGKMYEGATNIWYAQMANTGSLTALDESARFLTFGFSKMFGCIGIALAFIKTAKPENKAIVKGVVVPTLFVAVLAGITEPFEFAFLFISPLLWFVHSLLDGIFNAILYISGARISASNGIISLITSNITLSPALTKIFLLIPIGLAGIVAWYFSFVFLIKKFDIKTPGREDSGEVKLGGKKENSEVSKGNIDEDERIKNIVEGLGGPANIDTVNNCFTRLRIDVKDISLVNDDIINKSKNSGIVKKGNNVQIIIGMKVQTVRENICEYLNLE